MRRAGEALVPSPRWAWFLDLDGTLVPVARSPGAVRIDSGLRRLVESLYHSSGGAVALVSGRAIADLDRLFPGTPLAVVGQHGMERRTPSGRLAVRERYRARLDTARHELAEAVARHPRLVLEDKGLSLALHYRGAPSLAGYAHRLARSQLARLGASFCVRRGKRVVELRPVGRDKGRAVRAFMRERPFRGRTPVFIGDDVTDEDAFTVVNRLGGHSLKVGAGATAASWRLRDVAAVRGWLRRGRPAPHRVRRAPGSPAPGLGR